MRYIALCLALLVLAGCTTGGTRVTSTWKDPSLAQRVSGPVLVLARLNEPGTRRSIEDQSVAQLRKKGVNASAAYQALPEMAADDPSVMAKAQAAGAGALMLYTMGGQYTDVARAPGVSPGVGVGPFGVSVGPVLGGSKAEQRTAIDVQIFPLGSNQPVWAAHYDINLKEGLQRGIADVPARVADQARGDGAL